MWIASETYPCLPWKSIHICLRYPTKSPKSGLISWLSIFRTQTIIIRITCNINHFLLVCRLLALKISSKFLHNFLTLPYTLFMVHAHTDHMYLSRPYLGGVLGALTPQNLNMTTLIFTEFTKATYVNLIDGINKDRHAPYKA